MNQGKQNVVFEFLSKFITNNEVLEKFRELHSLEELYEFLKKPSYSRMAGVPIDERERIMESLNKALQGSLKGKTLRLSMPYLERSDPPLTIDLDPGVVFTFKRKPPILVMGNSGSGKTTFALTVLPKLLQYEDFFVVFMNANKASKTRTLTNAKAVAENMKKEISDAIKNSNYTDNKSLTMVVIVDEVGIKKDEQYVGKDHDLDDIVDKLKDLARDVQLVLSGTGLDQITTSINSNQSSIKIRLKPWGEREVKAFIEANRYQNPEELSEVISSTYLLKCLSSNPRALFYLTGTINNQRRMYGKQMINVDFVIASVVESYVLANGLASLTPEERRWVAMLVWRALSIAEFDSANKIDLSTIDSIDCQNSDKITACCHSLIDINLESADGELKLINGKNYAVSITSAISIVLFALTGNVASLCRTWNEFEFIAALHELQLAYVENYPQCPPPIKVVASRTVFPGSPSVSSIRVPEVNKNTILINGSKAEYADVISFGRLVQAKHQENGIEVEVDLCTELSKMGVMKNSVKKYQKSVAVTEYLRNLWSTDFSEEGIARMPMISEETKNDKEQKVTFNNIYICRKRHGVAVSKLSTFSDKKEFPHIIEEIERNTTPAKRRFQEQPLRVCFVTNAQRIKICNTYIQRYHVDQNGKLLETDLTDNEKVWVQANSNDFIKEFLRKNLLDGVSVHFYFIEPDWKRDD